MQLIKALTGDEVKVGTRFQLGIIVGKECYINVELTKNKEEKLVNKITEYIHPATIEDDEGCY